MTATTRRSRIATTTTTTTSAYFATSSLPLSNREDDGGNGDDDEKALPRRRSPRSSLGNGTTIKNKNNGCEDAAAVASTSKKRRAVVEKTQVVVVVTPDVATSATTSNNGGTTTTNKKATAVTTKKEEPTAAASPTTPKKKKQRRQPSPPSSSPRREPPEGWQDVYELVTELRRDRTAPVDHSGCEELAEKDASPEAFRFQVLVSLILSSQTKDAVVGEAVRAMQRDGVLSVDAISDMPAETLNGAYLSKVGFHNNKTRYLKETVEILKSSYGGDIPPTADSMMEDLPGVGPKMAYICESVAWGRQSGIGVDTHMHRLFNVLGWVSSKTPEHTRVQLEAWLPREYWPDVNVLWVGFGQEVQQFKPTLLRKALSCSRPAEALRLIKKCGLDYIKEGRKLGLEGEIRSLLAANK